MTAPTDFFESTRRHHASEVEQGLHDSECEWRDNGHFLCNCSKRRRIADGYTTPPGPLIFRAPDCPRCHNETYHDGDGFACDGCHVHWPDPDMDAEFNDDHGELDPAPYDQRRAAEGVTSRG